MPIFLRVAVMIIAMGLWSIGISSAQDGLTKQDRQGPVTVAVTLIGPPANGDPVKAKVVLDTHSVPLDGIVFERVVVIRTPEGADIAPTTVEQAKGSGHHREAVLVFPPVSTSGLVRIVVRDVGGIAERNFSWELSPTR
ncbi:MAG: hypothetical protein HYS14_02955 [Candidatus Rokubacteria bacterium]|nr:hypothetical protein [Candidatus Rokubacteria bacterium]